MSKTYINLKIRLRQEGFKDIPEYTEEQLLSKLVDGTAKFTVNDVGTIFIIDTEKLSTNKIIAVIENKKALDF